MTITGDRRARAQRREGRRRTEHEAVDAAILADREAVRARLDHEARLGRAAAGRLRSRPARSPWTWRSASVASRAAGSPRSSAPSRRARPRSASTSSPRPSASGGVAAFIDVEHALDPGYARACGVNVDELLVSQPDTGEQALEITETLIRSGGIDCVVVDSVAALVPRAEIEGEMGDSFVGIQARLMSQALRKLTGAVSRSNTVARLHEPAPREDRRHVRQSRDDARWPRAEVLRQRPPRHPADRDDQDRHRVGRQPGPGQGREEQGRAAVPGRRVRRHVRRGHLARKAACSTSAWRWTSSTRPAPGSPSTRPAWARAARRRRSSSRRTRTIAAEIDRRIRGRDRRGASSRSRASKRPSRPPDRATPVTDRRRRRRRPASRTPSDGAPARGDRRSRGRPGGRAPLPRGAGAFGRGDAPAADARPATDPSSSRARSTRLLELGHARRRGVRAALGRVARPSAAARRDRPQARAAVSAASPSAGDRGDDSTSAAARRGGPSGACRADDGAERRPDEAAAARLLERRRRDLERVADPRKRRASAPTPCSPGTASIRRSRHVSAGS